MTNARAMVRLSILVAVLLVGGCSGGAPDAKTAAGPGAPGKLDTPLQPASSNPPAAEAAREQEEVAPTGTASRFAGDPRIGAYVSTPWGFTTSSYWIEGPEGLVVIDTQFLPSAAAELIEKSQAITGKKVALAIVLHANPDKFNGRRVVEAH